GIIIVWSTPIRRGATNGGSRDLRVSNRLPWREICKPTAITRCGWRRCTARGSRGRRAFCSSTRSNRVVSFRVLTEFLQAEHAINAIYPHRHHLSAKVRSFIDLLVKHFHEDPGWADPCSSRPAPEPPLLAPVVD